MIIVEILFIYLFTKLYANFCDILTINKRYFVLLYDTSIFIFATILYYYSHVHDNGKIIAGCVARMYCWDVAYVDTLWVDENYRGKGLGSKLLAKIEKPQMTKAVI